MDVQHQPGIARDGAEASLAVPAAPAEPKVEQPESKIPKPDPRADECEDGLADAPMVSREDQREFKEIKEIPIKAKAKAKSNPKSMKRPASSKAYKSKKPASKADGGATDGESEDGLHATQHYSPPSSPVEPRALDGAFKEVASPTSSDADGKSGPVVPPSAKVPQPKPMDPARKPRWMASQSLRSPTASGPRSQRAVRHPLRSQGLKPRSAKRPLAATLMPVLVTMAVEAWERRPLLLGVPPREGRYAGCGSTSWSRPLPRRSALGFIPPAKLRLGELNKFSMHFFP